MTVDLRQRPPAAVGASRTAGLGAVLPRRVLVAVVIGAFMSFAGVFGSRPIPLAPRTVFMVAVAVAARFMGAASFAVVGRSRWIAARWWRQGAAAALLMTLPVALAVWLGLQLVLGRPLPFPSVPELLPDALVASLFFCLWAAWADASQPPDGRAAEAPAAAAAPRFLERLPPKLRGAELWAVEAEDHYLRLHTSRGQDLILMRLGDALAELEGADGAQTHRSWWVAREAVAGVRRADGRATLTLKNGVEAPVSRTHGRALRARGWY
jgi:hypothetical protein